MVTFWTCALVLWFCLKCTSAGYITGPKGTGKEPGTRNCGQEMRDLVFITDESGSIPDADFLLQREFIISLLGCLSLSETEVKVSLLAFAERPRILFDFNQFNNDVPGAQDFVRTFDRTTKRDETRTERAFRRTREDLLTAASGDRQDKLNIIIVLTDGASTQSTATLEEFRLFDFTVNEFFFIGIGPEINMTELQLLAPDPIDEHLFLLTSFADLAPLKDTVVSFLCPPCHPTCKIGERCDRPTGRCICLVKTDEDECEGVTDDGSDDGTDDGSDDGTDNGSDDGTDDRSDEGTVHVHVGGYDDK